jgi:hypothetical protein
MRGAVEMIAAHSSRTAARLAFERTLASAGWDRSQLPGLRVAAHCGSALAATEASASVRRLLAYADYNCTPLSEIDADDLRVIKQLSKQPACRNCPALTPERWPEAFEPATSLVLRRAKRLVGWIVTERQDAAADHCPSIHYAASYIDSALSRTGALTIAYHQAFARQLTGFGAMSLVRFEAPVITRDMFAFVRRRVAPIAVLVDEVFLSRKRLLTST